METLLILFFILAILVICLMDWYQRRLSPTVESYVPASVIGGETYSESYYGEASEMREYLRMARDDAGEFRGVFEDAAEKYLTDYQDMEDNGEFGFNSDDPAVDL